MRYKNISKELFIANRGRLVKELKANAVVVVNANDIMPTNSDGTMRFRQNSDLFYLTGVDQEETILVMCPSFPDKKFREVLFLRETNEHIATWEGYKLTKEEARSATGIETVLWVSEFAALFKTMMVMGDTEHVYLNTNDHYRADPVIESREMRFVKYCMQKFPLHRYERLAPILHKLRSIKSQAEIDLLQQACDITASGFNRLLKFVKPGVTEYEIEAELAHEFLRLRSRGFAYDPIIASGANSCVLHYVDNSKACNAGEVLLLDVGAEYANYNADLTRTIPVSGKYSKRQKDVYSAVLHVQREAIKLLKEGEKYYDYHREVQKIMESQLIDLNLIDKTDIKHQEKENALLQKYFMHGTGHQLGLDVHDVGNIYHEMAVGQVWTVEPGIYIREESLGVRIENNVLITKDGVLDLMRAIPIEAAEIEEIMNS